MMLKYVGKGIRKLIMGSCMIGVVLAAVACAAGSEVGNAADDTSTKAATIIQSEANTIEDSTKDVENEQVTMKQTAAVVENAMDGNERILMATAQNDNDLTGTYVDESSDAKIILIQKDGKVAYNFCSLDGSDAFIETDCTIETSYIAGQYYYISKNMDGSLAISSGAGGSWGNFVKVDNEAVINLDDMDPTMLGEESSAELSYSLSLDVENGLLYANADGKITDSVGNQIPEYDYLFASPVGGLVDTSDNCILDGYSIAGDGQIYLDIPPAVDYEGTNTNYQQSSLLPTALESFCATGIVYNSSGSYTYMEDDGGYFDEVILGAWFDENGIAKADGFPKKLDDYLWNHVGVVSLDNFKFIDCTKHTLDSVKRDSVGTGDQSPTIYAVLISDVQKRDTGAGIAYEGYEYTSKQPVVMHGNFSGILNGDDILVFATYRGLGSDDTPNYQGYYVEVRGLVF